MKKNIVVLSGAGISAESGIKTFRDHDGLWEGHDVMEVATPEGFNDNPKLVLDFYNQRRAQLLTVKPNKAHFDLANLEKDYTVTIITQNVDDLHERAGSTNVIHLHGELLKARSVINETDIIPWTTNINLGDTNSKGEQLRPHIVWFGENVPLIDKAISICKQADIIIIVGTSLQVYPAASLMEYAPSNCNTFYVDKNPSKTHRNTIITIAEPASTGIEKVIDLISENL